MKNRWRMDSIIKKEKWKLFKLSVLDSLERNATVHTEIWDGNRLCTEGCDGVMDYSDTYILLRMKKGKMTVWGSALSIEEFDGGTITVSGRITSLELD